MDLLFKRYASPFALIDGYIGTGRFCAFLHNFIHQKEEDDRWEYFLHKVWDKSYTEFCELLTTSQGVDPMTDADIEATIKQSMNILGNYRPREGEGEINGSI